MKGRILALICFSIALVLCAATPVAAQDGVDVTVTPGPNPGDLTITWSGGQPLFEIFRSTSASDVLDAANKIGETTDRMFVDTPPTGEVYFYKITSPCVSNPPEVCDGVDNDCDGTVDEAGAEDSCTVANASATCVAGGCAVDLCDPGFDDCDLDPLNGCEIDVDNDDAHCGACGNVCALANAGADCAAGDCRVTACVTGFEDCDAMDSTGCEAELAFDAANCGTCGNACDYPNAAGACNASSCEMGACEIGFEDCDLSAGNGCEIDTANDLGNCGACGSVCLLPNAVSVCGAGTCALSACNNDFWDINGDPADGCEYACVYVSAVDEADGNHIDENCDGVDGDLATSIFVSPTGSDGFIGSIDYPMATIGAALVEAQTSGASRLILDLGTYTESVDLIDGIDIHGGYDRAGGWSRDGIDMSVVLGGTTAITANDIVSETVLEFVHVESASATSPGMSSYGVLATNSPGLWLRDSLVLAGAGGEGVNGSNGSNGLSGYNGSAGRRGCENSSGLGCSDCARPTGGVGGGSSCGRSGGRGGSAGVAGNYGYNGSTGSGSGPGYGGSAISSGRGNWNPTYGLGGNGSAGVKGSNGAAGQGTFDLQGFLVTDGLPGGPGQHGSGGGGGGGGGGGTASCDSYGGGGGGGGGGGCAGNGGQGGRSGGGSFAVYLSDSDARIDRCALQTTAGGRGGNGGGSGPGGNGGAGGNCGSNKGNCYGGSGEQDDGSNGARGGNGGKGGDGGAGGGGQGGPSLGLARVGTSAPAWTDLAFDIGPGGSAGTSQVNDGGNGVQSTIYPTYCGNGFVDVDRDMNEECDDGNMVAGDGCDGECRVESGWSCRGSECGRMGTAAFVHDGNTDPNVEGWTKNDGPAGTSASPVSADLGLNAWNINDFGTASGTRLTYSRDVAEVSPYVADASANGWVLRLRLRIVKIPDSLDFSVYSEYANGAHRWFLYFGNDADGHPIAAILGGSAVTLSDLDAGYHLYELVYDPDAGDAKLYVDGVLRTSGPGEAIALTRVNFGSGQSGTTGSGNYSRVEWFPLSCGNGAIDADEQCDDDNLNDGDGCSSICTLE